MKKINSLLILVFIALIHHAASAQKQMLTMDDVVLASRRGLVPEKLEQLQWKGTENEFVFVQKRDKTEFLVAGKPGEKTYRDIVSLSMFNQSLKTASLDSFPSFPVINWTTNDYFTFEAGGKTIGYDLKSAKAAKILDPANNGAANKSFNSECRCMAYTIENNIWINTNSGNKQVTFDSIAGIVNGQIVHREEFGINKGIYFSPGGNYFAFYRMDQTMVTDYPVLNLSKLPAEVDFTKYPMAGGKSHHVTIGIYDIKSGKTVFLNTGEPADQYLTNIAWTPDEKKIYVAVLNRGQDHMRMNRYDVLTGNFEAAIFEETDKKYVHPRKPVHFNKDGSLFVWKSRRDGYDHLYLYESSGKLVRQLTSGKWEVDEFIRFDAEGKNIFYTSNEINPIHKDIFSVPVTGGKRNRISVGEGIHKGMISNSGDYVIDEWTGPGVPRTITVWSSSGKKMNSLLTAANPLKNFQPVIREIFTIKNENGDDLYCRMIKPGNFDSSKVYPVIVYVYGGPNVQLITNTWTGGSDLWAMYMAQRGFIIFTLENRGTPMRGKDFEQAVFRNLGEAELADQMAGIKYLVSKHYIDKNRMGVYGWSYGGFMAASLMTRHPGIFSTAVAGGPVIDWRYYEVMYTERYMDTPAENPDGYEKSSLLNYVDKLKGKMLLIHGTSDWVVVWQQSLVYLKKAVDKNVQLDYFVYPGHEHNVHGRDRIHLLNKISQYFEENFR